MKAANDESQTKIAKLTSSIEALEGNNGKLVGEKKEAEAGSAAELAKLNQEIAQVDSALARERMTNQITQAANQLLIRPDAMDDVIRLAEAKGIRYVEGNLIAGDGGDATVLDATEWLDSLRETKPYTGRRRKAAALAAARAVKAATVSRSSALRRRTRRSTRPFVNRQPRQGSRFRSSTID